MGAEMSLFADEAVWEKSRSGGLRFFMAFLGDSC
jgi:hypothetical protein